MMLQSSLVLSASLLPLSAWAVDTRSEAGRPRGVGPDFAKFYKDTTKFTCISNPSISIPTSRVNDDYCDCPDGSDEPGTSACSYLSGLSPHQYPPSYDSARNTTLALPGFYCKNKGHLPFYLRFESVNDGRCDYDLCCDGSDEHGHVGGIKCPNKCGEIGKEYRKHEDQRNRSYQAAIKRRKEMVKQAETLKLQVESQIQLLQSKIEAQEQKVSQAKESLLEVERKEKMRVVRGSAGGSGKVGILLGLAKGRVAELRTSLDKTKSQRDSMVQRVGELEGILTALKQDRNPNFNDEGVKTAVRAWEEYAARETSDHWSDAEDRDLDSVLKEDSADNGVNWSEFEGSDDTVNDVAALYTFTNYLPPAAQKWVDDKITMVRQLLVDNGVLASETEADVGESKAVQDARTFLSDAERNLVGLNSELSTAQTDLGNDYGPDSIFRALKDKCISQDSGEYVYELCFLDKTKQKSKKGGSDTNMGNFVGFEIEYVDEDLPADGKGLGKGERVVMKFENGQHCWNGPNRSTRVVLACSENEEIWKVSESEKCVYRMEAGTAAVCGYGGSASSDSKTADDPHRKDEL